MICQLRPLHDFYYISGVICTQVKIYVCDVISECAHILQAESFLVHAMLYQLSRRSSQLVRVGDILELSL